MKLVFRLSFVFLFSFIVCIGAEAQGLGKKKVAVYVSGTDVDKSITKVLGAKLVTAITSSGNFAAVERSSEFLNALEKENSFQLEEVRASQIAKLGQKFGVKYVVAADVSEVFGELFVSARLINVETGLIDESYDTSGPADSLQDIIRLSQDVAGGLLKGLSGKTGNGQSYGSGRNLNGHEYVDLGLPSGLKWATCNVGASTPSDYGNYFAWGETYTKGDYSESTCRTYNRTYGDIGGNVEFDPALANWGGSWRLPTKSEFEELLNNCSWSFVTMGSHNGYKVIGPNGNWIFLPAAGYRYGSSLGYAGSRGDYWSSAPLDSQGAYGLYFDSSGRSVCDSGRYYGQSVRAVSE